MRNPKSLARRDFGMLAPVGLDVHQLAPGSIIARDFRVTERLAEGGMGTVYVVEQLSTRRRRALKVMRPELVRDERSRQRFLQEAQIGATINSEHVVEVIAAGVDEPSGALWLAMELLSGQSLSQHVAEHGAMDPRAALAVFRQLCHALEGAHRAGVVHRDLKPENVFVASARRSDVDFTVKVLDFGIAKWLSENREMTTQAIGTPFWMAPEQADAGASVTAQTDIWPLGLLAFYVLTGKQYWKAANTAKPSLQMALTEMLVAPLEAPSARSAALSGAPLPARFDAFFARCVARDPRARFINVAAALRALDDALSGRNDAGPSLPRTARMSDAELAQVASPQMAPVAPTERLRTTPPIAAPPIAAPRRARPVAAPPRARPPARGRWAGCATVAAGCGVVSLCGFMGLLWFRATAPPPPTFQETLVTRAPCYALDWQPLKRRPWTRLYHRGAEYPELARAVQSELLWDTGDGTTVRLFVPPPVATGGPLGIATTTVELQAEWPGSLGPLLLLSYPWAASEDVVDQDLAVHIGERVDGRVLVSMEALRQRGRLHLPGLSKRFVMEWDPATRRPLRCGELWEGPTAEAPPHLRVNEP